MNALWKLLLIGLIFCGLRAHAQPFLQRYENMYVLLRTGIPATLPGAAIIKGLEAQYDGNGGIYLWDDSSSGPTNADKSRVQIPGVDPGLWIRLTSIGTSSNSPGGNTYITNLFVTNITTITINSVTNITENLYVTNLFATYITTVTNITETLIVQSNVFFISTNVFINGNPAIASVGTAPWMPYFLAPDLLTNSYAYVDTTNQQTVFTGLGGSTFYNSLRLPDANEPIYFGAGAGNYAYSTGSTLVITNATPGLRVQNSSTTLTLALGGGSNGSLSSGGTLQITSAGTSLLFNSATDVIYPTSSATTSWGKSENPFASVFVGGLSSGIATNYSDLQITHTGTNGLSILNSLGNGIAGTARPLQVRFDGAANVTFNPAGPIGLGTLTKAQKTAITTLTNGMVVYQSDNTPGLRAYINGAWVIVSTAADP